MAEVDTLMLSQEHSDIRREATEHTNEIIKEGLKESFNTRGDINDTRYDIANRVENAADRTGAAITNSKDEVVDRLFTIGRESADNRAQIVALGYQLRDGLVAVSKDTEISVLKNTIEGQKNTTYLSDKITNDGEKTRALINELKYGDLNRALIERNSELVEERHAHRHWRGNWDQSQFQSVASQLQAFQSQLQETRQGMVNFGTMAGVGQSSTSNNVR